MELHFRFAKEEDIRELIDVCNECFDETTNYDEALHIFRKTKQDSNQLYLIGLLNGKL